MLAFSCHPERLQWNLPMLMLPFDDNKVISYYLTLFFDILLNRFNLYLNLEAIMESTIKTE